MAFKIGTCTVRVYIGVHCCILNVEKERNRSRVYNMLEKTFKQFLVKIKVVKQFIILNKHFSVHFSPMLIMVPVTGRYGWIIWVA